MARQTRPRTPQQLADRAEDRNVRRARSAPPGRSQRPGGISAAQATGVRPVVQAPPTEVRVASGHGLSFWAVVVMALVMVALVGATGHWSTGFWIALLILLLVGALWPPAALLLGGAALLYLTLTHGRPFLSNVSALLSQKPALPGGTQA